MKKTQLTLEAYRIQDQRSFSVDKDGARAVRITVQGAVPVLIEQAVVRLPGQEWTENCEPGEELSGSILVSSTTGVVFDIAVEIQYAS